MQRGPDGLFAYVVNNDGKVEMRKLDVSVIQDGSVVMNGGSRQGERVVTSGYYRLQPGMSVKFRNGEDRNSVVGKRSAAQPAAVELE